MLQDVHCVILEFHQPNVQHFSKSEQNRPVISGKANTPEVEVEIRRSDDCGHTHTGPGPAWYRTGTAMTKNTDIILYDTYDIGV